MDNNGHSVFDYNQLIKLMDAAAKNLGSAMNEINDFSVCQPEIWLNSLEEQQLTQLSEQFLEMIGALRVLYEAIKMKVA